MSLETMHKSNKTPQIDDAEESISFDSPQSKATTSTAASQNSPNLLLDIHAPAASGVENASSAYDYIETVDYLQQLGSEPASPEVVPPSNSTSINMSGLNASINTNESVFESSQNCSKTPYENLLGLTSSASTTKTDSPNMDTSVTPTSDTTSSSSSTVAAAAATSPTSVHNNLPFDVEATPENGYGKGAIPKQRRAQDPYYQLWGAPAVTTNQKV